jgi:hypothetical protein
MATTTFRFTTSNASGTVDLSVSGVLQGTFSNSKPFSAHFAPGQYDMQITLHGTAGDSCTSTVTEATTPPKNLLTINPADCTVPAGQPTQTAFGFFTVT